MKKLYNLLEKVGLKKKPTPLNVQLNMYSQGHVLKVRMGESNLKHGDTTIADLMPVRLEECPGGVFTLYFCPLQVVWAHHLKGKGDGRPLPETVTVDKFKPLVKGENMKGGLYNLKNVQLYSNGTIQLISTPETELVPFEREY